MKTAPPPPTVDAVAPSPPGHRALRSYVLRAGRMGSEQQRALAALGPRCMLPFSPQPADFDAAFGRSAPTVVEIGFGVGQATAQIAAALPECNFVGIEVHEPGGGALLERIDEVGLANLRLIRHDALAVLEQMIAPASSAGIASALIRTT